MKTSSSSSAHAPLKTVYGWVEERNQTVRMVALGLILLTLGLTTLLVYLAGGSFVVYTHGMYVPLVIAGLMFGLRGGLATAVLAGLLLGPVMPLDVITGATQPLINWGFRLVYFLLVGFIIGGSSDLIRDHIVQLRWRFLHNEVSNLLNRDALIEELNLMLVQLPAAGGAATDWPRLFLIDITNLNELSLKLGPAIEKTTISALARELSGGLRDGELTFHVRSNRLAILVPNNAQQRLPEIEALIEQAIATPVEYEEIPLLLHCVWSDIKLDDAQLSAHDYLRRLEMAINDARSKRISHSNYSRSLGLKSRENLATLGLLKHALDEESFVLRYQPKYRLSDRKTIGAEALISWEDPSRGVVPASEFIPLAEQSLLINPITLWVIERAARDLAPGGGLHGLGLDSVAVNISAVNLGQPSFVASLTRILETVGIPPQRLEIELTESEMVQDLDAAVARLNAIAALGIKLSIDDFGTGFSSLQYLERLPVSSVKIDQMFIQKMQGANSTQTIVRSTIDLAHSLGFSVVAEGIETQSIEDQLRELGCDFGQGYHFGRPVTTEQFSSQLAANS